MALGQSAEFLNLPVMPLSSLLNHRPIGGPVWPNFEHQTFPRFCRNGIPCDEEPKSLPISKEISEALCWGGVVHPEFGHFLAEHSTRLLSSVTERPDCKIAVIAPMVSGAMVMPPFAYDVFEWFGISSSQLLIVEEPVMVRKLFVFEQGDMLGRVPTVPDYLDKLDLLAERRNFGSISKDIEYLYVGRIGLPSLGRGGHLGEAYLVSKLLEIGVHVVDPTKTPIIECLKLFWRSRNIIFAEGSALHMRQLLGRLNQNVIVLRRRPKSSVGRIQLSSRAARTRYLDISRDFYHLPTNPKRSAARKFRTNLSVCMYDSELLLEALSSVGLSISSLWEEKKYRETATDDLNLWKAARNRISRGSDKKIISETISVSGNASEKIINDKS